MIRKLARLFDGIPRNDSGIVEEVKGGRITHILMMRVLENENIMIENFSINAGLKAFK
jgi:hypothetical protein